MKAIVYTKYGTPDVLELREVAKPVPKDNEVLVKVHAVSLNDWDVALLDGDLINRMINGMKSPRFKFLDPTLLGQSNRLEKMLLLSK